AQDFLVAVKRGGSKAVFLGSAFIGNDNFAARFSAFDEDKKKPGFFTEGVYGLSHLIYDSAGSPAQDFAAQYAQAFGAAPTSWNAAKFYNAAKVTVAAIQAAEVENTPQSVKQDRERVQQRLAAMSSPATGTPGVDG